MMKEDEDSQVPDRPPVSIIIVTFNSAETLRDCLASVLRTTMPEDEIVIVDNASADATVAMVEKLLDGRSGASIVRNSENLGYSKAANLGIDATSHELIVLLNPDTVVRPRWLERTAWRAMEPGVGAVGPTSNFVSGEQFVNFHLPPSKHKGLGHDELHEVIERYNNGLSRDTKLLVGFCLMTRRTVLDQVGKLDEDLVLGSDDLELSWRLRLNRYRLVIARDVYVQHMGQVSFRSLDETRKQKQLDESTAVFRTKLARHYAPEPVPTSEELWGVSFF